MGQPCAAAMASAITASFTSRPSRSARRRRGEHPLVVLGHDLAEPFDRQVPVGEQPAADRGIRLGIVPLDDLAQEHRGRRR